MKSLLIKIIIFLSIYTNVSAQNKTERTLSIDKDIIKIEYKETSIFIEGVPNYDKMSLYISDDYVYSKTEFNFDATNAEKIMSKLESVAVIEADMNDYFSEIYINKIPIKKVDFKTDISVGYVPYCPVFLENKTVYENFRYIKTVNEDEF